MARKKSIPKLPFELRDARIDLFGRTGRYFSSDSGSSSSILPSLAMLASVFKAFNTRL